MTAASEVSGGRDVTISIAQAQAITVFWLVGAALLVLGPFWWAWGSPPIGQGVAVVGEPLVLVPGIVLGVLVHEGLHALGFLVAGGAPPGAVRIGVDRRTLTPFARCTVPVTASAYRVTALLPAAVLGLLPAVAGWVTGAGALAVAGFLLLAVAGGDLAAVWAIRGVPAGALVLDHPTRVGCTVLDG